MKLNKFLVVIDGDHGRQPALRRAAWLAKKTGASLELIFIEYNPAFDGVKLFDNEGMELARNSLINNKREWVEEIAQPYREEGLNINIEVRWGKPMHKIALAYADEIKPDILFKSAYSESLLRRLFLSNSSWQLIRQSHTPLWLVQHGEWDGKRLCAAVDPLHSSDKPAILDNQLVTTSQELGSALGMEANFLHCYAAMPRPQLFGNEQIVAYENYVRDYSKEHRDAFEKLLGQYQGIPEENKHLIEGFAEEVIPRFVLKKHIDLLVMGAVSRSQLDTMLIGHTAERILESIECDLLIIKPQAE